MAYLFDESFRRTRVLIANCFEIEIHSSGAKFLRFLDFQAITLFMNLDGLDFLPNIMVSSVAGAGDPTLVIYSQNLTNPYERKYEIFT